MGRDQMPNQTFFNLSKDKRERIIQSAMKVFSKHPLTDASISEIVEGANISRGSFYQYFEDKTDLYMYLVGLFKKNYHTLMIQKFKKYDGDFYKGYRDYSCFYIQNITESKKFGFFENLYLGMNYQLNRENIDVLFTDEKKRRLYDEVDLDNMKISTPEDLMAVLQFLHELLNNAIMEGFWRNLSVEETQAIFLKRLDWVFYGISKINKEGDVS